MLQKTTVEEKNQSRAEFLNNLARRTGVQISRIVNPNSFLEIMADTTFLKTAAENLKNSHLAEVKLNPETLSLSLEFRFWPNEGNATIECGEVMYFSFSKDPEDEEVAFFILDVFIEVVADGGRSTLDQLGFPWKDKEGYAAVDDCEAYYIYTIGDICLNIVCRKLLLNSESKK